MQANLIGSCLKGVVAACAAVVCAVGALAADDVFFSGRVTDYAAQEDLVACWDGVENAGVGRHDASATVWKDLKQGLEVTLPSHVVVEDDAMLSKSMESASGSGASLESIPGADDADVYTVEQVIQSTGWKGSGINYNNLQCAFSTPRGSFGYRQNRDNGFYTYKPNTDAQMALYNWLPSDRKVSDKITTTSILSVKDRSLCKFYANASEITKSLASASWSDNYGTKWGFFTTRWCGVRVCSIRVYKRALTPEEIAHNQAVDDYRFVQGKAIVKPVLVVSATPQEYGSVTPAYGTDETDHQPGDPITCTAPASWTSDDGLTRATCVGYQVMANGSVAASESFTGDGVRTAKFDFPAGDAGARLVWQWSVEYKIVAGEGATVSPEWAKAGDTVTITATVPEGKAFYRWTDTLTGTVYAGNPLRVKATGLMNLVPEFGKAIYVATDGDDAAGDGSSAKPYKTLAKALAVATTADNVILKAGTYTITAEATISSAITVRGETGRPEDVVIAASGAIRPFTLNHAEARIEAVTLANGKPGGGGGGVLLESKGGVVRNCVVTNCCANSWAGCGGAFYLNGANALVENCVVSNCWNSTAGGLASAINYGGGIAAYLTSGTIRNTLFFHNVSSGGRDNKGHVVALNKGGLVENCTVVGNHTYYGSGIWAVGVGKATVRNCLMSDNTSYDDQTGTWTAWYGDADCFENCIAPVYINDTCIVDERSIRDFANGDFTPVGAAVDAGAGSEWHATAVDLAGKARMSGTAPDIGCFELDQSVAGLDVKVSVVHGLAPLEVVFTPRVFGLTGAQTIEWDLEGRDTWDVESAGAVTKTFAAGRWTVRARVKDSNAVVSSPIEIVAAPKTLYVNPGCGTPEFPYGDENHAATSVAEAYDVAVDGCEIVLAPMTHVLDDTLRVMKAVTVRGATDDAADTVMTLSASVKKRVVELQHPQAALSSVTVTGGACSKTYTEQGQANGGGAYVNACGGTVSNCVFRDNKTTAWAAIGGALWVAGKSALVTHCVFSNNTCEASGSTSTDQGGGLAVYMTAGTLRNSLFIRNTSGKTTHANRGGTVFMTDGVIESCSFAKNTHTLGAGVRATGGIVRNCLIGGNTCTGTASYEGHGEQWVGKAACFENCLTDGATPINDSCDVANDPFTSVATEDLTPCAAAVDTATPQEWMVGATDLAGLARIQGKGPDLGCYEKDMSKFSAIVEVDKTKAIAPYEATFTVTLFGVGDQGVTCSWDWDGDGTWDEATDGSTTHVFEAGSYSTRVLVTDKASGKTSAPELPFNLTMVPKTIYVDDASEHPAAPYQNWDCAAKTLADAYAVAVDECEIVMATGTYDVSTVLELKQNVAIRGATGNPNDVVLRMAKGANSRHFIVNNALASLSGVTLENGSGNGGGAVLIEAFGGMVSNCVFSGNKVTSWGSQGGAIKLNSAAALVTHCVFTNNLGGSANDINSGDTQGGSHAVSIESGTVRNSLFVNNGVRTHVASKGGVVTMNGGILENCTFARNADGYCAGVRAYNAAAVVRNCVFAEYDCPNASSAAMAVIFNAATADRFDHCCSPVEFGGSWIKTDAPFVDATHGDWSPAAAIVDKAAPQDWMDGATDLAGNARVSGSAPDIGCYEKDQDRFSALVEVSALRAIAPYEATFTVTTFGVGDKGVTCHWDWNGDGTWDDTSIGTTTHVYDVGAHATKVKVVDNASGAVFDPAAPFDLLIAPKTICVDCNSENPSAPYQNWNCAAKTLADAYAVAVDGCEIVVATGTYGVSSVIEVTKEVKFRSATGNPGDVVLRMADKAASRHFFLNNAQSALLGLTLENASGLNGGSVFIEAFGGTVSNCVFSGNKSSSGWGQQGGAIYLNSADALVTHCVFTNNLGGSANNIDSGNSQGGGHALHIEKGNVRNCLFVGNGNRTHKASKGGVVVMNGGVLDSCTFVKNADSHCAGVHAYNAAAVVRNCLFAEYDCPDATSEAMAVIFDATTASRYDHCCSPLELGGSWVKATDPQFRKPAKGDWRLKDKSPAVNAGVWCDWMDGATDLLGNPRKVLDNPDIGCYECPCSGLMLLVR